MRVSKLYRRYPRSSRFSRAPDEFVPRVRVHTAIAGRRSGKFKPMHGYRYRYCTGDIVVATETALCFTVPHVCSVRIALTQLFFFSSFSFLFFSFPSSSANTVPRYRAETPPPLVMLQFVFATRTPTRERPPHGIIEYRRELINRADAVFPRCRATRQGRGRTEGGF